MLLSVIRRPGGYVRTKVAALASLTPPSLARLLVWELSNETERCG